MKEKTGGTEKLNIKETITKETFRRGSTEKTISTLNRKITLLEQAFVANAEVYYNINLTRNCVPGRIYRTVEGERQDLNDQMGFPENAAFSDVTAYWGLRVPDEERKGYADFLSIPRLLQHFENGEYHIAHKYWTGNALADCMLAEQHIIMYEDEETGDVLGFSYVYDLTEQYRKEKEIKKELEKNYKELENALITAQHANHAKTTFLNNMSHDIRTPMNAIIGFTSLAASHIDNKEKIKEYLGKISTSSEHLLSLINDVLDMSRIERGKVKIEERPLHLPDLMHDIRTIIQPNIASKQLDFLIDMIDVKDEDIIADKLRLNQILLNILNNGIKFNKTGGTISLRIKQTNQAPYGYANYQFIIRDTGIGMSEEFREHIFEAFTREETSTVSGVQGTGLGMAITKNIVDMMGGTVTVNSEEGKGSEFIVSLTFKLSGDPVTYEKIEQLQGLRALVADDDTDTCLNISNMLTEIGMRPEWTVSGKEAVIRAKQAVEIGDEFSAYIIDWLMPDMNGIETVRRIRRVIGDGKPIIILTAYDWTDIEAEAREAGVTAFCEKPLFMSELRDILSRPYRAQEEPSKKEQKIQFAGKRLLLVEDNELNQEIAVTILEEAGFVVEVAEDGTVAVEKMKNTDKYHQYDLILMDIQMPKMDGYEATRQIRALNKPDAARIPIVAMTANAFEEDREKAFEAGMNGHLPKPIKVPELLKTLNQVLRTKE